ncbi:MAG: alkaline phosphatase family protein [Nevskia sp.]|nr:alkaline phosphatase family protein [Nevskia sp.]
MDRPARQPHAGLSRRQVLAGGAGALVLAAAGIQPAGAQVPPAEADHVAAALQALGRTRLREPFSRPFPHLAAGTDTLPGIEHIVVLMLENHSYDNLFGMLPRGDGFTLDAHGRLTASNPYADGRIQHAFHMPTTCQLPGKPGQEWKTSHIQYANGALDGFVISPSGPVAMGYWTGADLPFTYALASQFPIGDRWFCSVLGQTDPNRRYLIAGTSAGMVDDIGTSPGNLIPDLSLLLPAHGTIFNLLGAYGLSWRDYCAGFPTGATAELYPLDDLSNLANKKTIADFYADAAAGTLPDFCIIDPDYSTQSQENPQNIVVGEQFLAEVVQAIGASPAWQKTMLIVTYDEHGGYYDHVPPPPALAPDLIGPLVQPGESLYEGFRRYGFRVPSVVVSAYARRDHVSHVLHDHTSVLALVQRKWNLPALTWRDANANDLTDFLDLDALTAGKPTFPALPPLPPSGLNSATQACSTTGPGTIPPPGSVS